MSEPTVPAHDPDGGIVGLARRVAPELHVVSVSEAAPLAYNVVGFVSSTELAREIVLELESVSDGGGDVGQSDSATGVVVMGSRAAPEPAGGVDPEGVGRWLGPTVLAGLAAGAVAGGAIGAAIGAVLDGPVLASALAGAAMLSLFVAIWLSFRKLGGSEAYRETFVEPQARELTVVSFHTDDAERADDAYARLAQHPDVSPAVYDASLSNVLRR